MVILKGILDSQIRKHTFSKKVIYCQRFDLTSVFLFTGANKIRSTKNTAIAAFFLYSILKWF